MLAADPWEWRAVWVSGLAALQRRRLRRRAVGVQRRLRPGARRAGAQAGAGPGLRARRRGRRSPRGSTGPARAPTPTTSPPAAFGLARIRAGARRRRRRGAGARPGARRPAAASPRPGGCGPCTCYESGQGLPALAAGDGQPARRPARPARAGRAHRVAILERALAAVSAGGPKSHGQDRRVRRPATSRCATGSKRPTGSWPGPRPTTAGDGRLVDKANAVRRWTLTMTEPDSGDVRRSRRSTRPARSRPSTPALPLPDLRRAVSAEAAFCEACGAAADPPTAAGRRGRRRTSSRRRSS